MKKQAICPGAFDDPDYKIHIQSIVHDSICDFCNRKDTTAATIWWMQPEVKPPASFHTFMVICRNCIETIHKAMKGGGPPMIKCACGYGAHIFGPTNEQSRSLGKLTGQGKHLVGCSNPVCHREAIGNTEKEAIDKWEIAQAEQREKNSE